MPMTRLTIAAANDNPNDSFNAFSVRVAVTIDQNWAIDSSVVLTNSPASGISTMIDSSVRVRPMVRPNPGNVLCCTAPLTLAPACQQEACSDRDEPEHASSV